MSLVEQVSFDPDSGLVPAVVQSAGDDRVLMLGYMNATALRRTLDEGRVTFWSRSRQELWRKGDTSGHWLELREVRVDCDGDTLLVRARPHGPTCHTGAQSCFADGPRTTAGSAEDAGTGGRDGERRDPNGGRTVDRGTGGRGEVRASEEVPASDATPSDLDGAARSPAPVLASVLEELVRVVAERDRDRPEESYTTRLLEGGTGRVARKVGEEALEVALTAVDEPERLAEESADLLYHLAVLWRAAGLPADAVGQELSRRRRSGR